MTSLWVSEQSVRDMLGIDAATGRYGDGNIGSNVRAAQAYIERATSRQFEVQAATTKRFGTNGEPVVAIPDLATATSVTLQGSALEADQTYWLLPDARQSGVSVAIQLRQFGGRGGYLSNPEWFDRDLDSPAARAYASTGLPNDLVIVGDWGWADKPDDLLAGVKALAAWLLKRADAVLAGAVQTPDGAVLDYSQWPPEAQAVIRDYRRGSQAAVIA